MTVVELAQKMSMLQRNNIHLAVMDLLMQQQAELQPLCMVNDYDDYDGYFDYDEEYGEFDDGDEFTDLMQGIAPLDQTIYRLYRGLHHFISRV